MTKWAVDKLKEMLSLMMFSCQEYNLVFTMINPTGEANGNIRKGKKIITYELNVSIEWATIH